MCCDVIPGRGNLYAKSSIFCDNPFKAMTSSQTLTPGFSIALAILAISFTNLPTSLQSSSW